MENNPENPVVTTAEVTESPKNPRVSLPMWIAMGVAVLLLAGIAVMAFRSSVTQNVENSTQATKTNSNTKNTIVYGYWTPESSIINAYDISKGQNTIIATLPSNIKHVKVVSPTKIMFIKDTDERDYGKQLVARNLNTNQDEVVLQADNGFGIDDFIVSADGNYAAVWQVSPPANSVVLRGGRSRVTSIQVSSPTVKHTIYDEPTTSPVHYPVAVSNDGTIYMDRFLPNTDAGWARGMSSSSFNGSTKENLTAMADGTYSTQPVQSPDGTKIAFAGYNGSKGGGAQVVGGFRKAQANPNTVEIYDLASKTRSKLSESESAIFPSVYWDAQTGNVMYSTLSKNAADSGVFMFDMARNASNKIDLPPSVAQGEEAVVFNVWGILSDGNALVVDEDTDIAAMGNLGGKYSPTITAMYLLDGQTGEKARISLNGERLQLIALKSAGYFPANVGKASDQKEKDKQLQLQTFTIKPSLAPIRLAQQSGERCRDVAAAQCNSLHGTNYTGDEAIQLAKKSVGQEDGSTYQGKKSTNASSGSDAFGQCFNDQFRAAKVAGTCSDSPLYLYGTEGSRVNVSVGTPIYSVNTPYNPETGFVITLGKEGKFNANGKNVESLQFDYKPAIKATRPVYGAVVERAKVADLVKKYAQGLGLNEKETADTVSSIQSSVVGPYAFISFYDDATSRKILPLYFDPAPDHYRNIVFYVENLSEKPSVSYELPTFEKVTRGGFTAVEISTLVR